MVYTVDKTKSMNYSWVNKRIPVQLNNEIEKLDTKSRCVTAFSFHQQLVEHSTIISYQQSIAIYPQIFNVSMVLPL